MRFACTEPHRTVPIDNNTNSKNRRTGWWAPFNVIHSLITAVRLLMNSFYVRFPVSSMLASACCTTKHIRCRRSRMSNFQLDTEDVASIDFTTHTALVFWFVVFGIRWMWSMPLDRARWYVHSTWMSPPDYIDDDIGTAMLLISMDSVRNLIDALRMRDAYTVRLAIQQECCVYLICLRCNLQFSVIDECTMFSSLGMHWIEWFTRLSLSLCSLSEWLIPEIHLT